MSNILDKVRALALERGWTDGMALNLVCSFLDHENTRLPVEDSYTVEVRLEEFLGDVVKSENEISEVDAEDLVALKERHACS
jgi:hypothetical protein|tara:strand:+ start:3181 stop:3426 length:246 start_codon:yes stop_codon:yes gene_type:complete